MATSATRALGAAVLAGVMAGALTALLHLALAEPLIERAIAVEQHTNLHHGGSAEAPIVTRATQRKGLVVGLLVYGVVWGALLSVVYTVIDSRRGVWDPATRAWAVTLVVAWAVAWFPFLKYPANPPGVGEAVTFAYRETLYVSFVALSAGGAGLTFVLTRWHAGRTGEHRGKGSSRPVMLYAAYAIVLYVAMPGNPDPIRMPSSLVWTFRAISFGGLVLLWVSMGISFDWLLRRRASTFGGRLP